MTSKISTAVLAGTAVLAVTLGSTSAQAATASATARARVLRALTLANNNRPLEFGAVVATGSAGNVVISAAGTRTCDTTISCSGTVSAAQFDLTGTASEVVVIDAAASVTLTSGTNSMTASLQESAATVTLSGTGTGAFSVGGTLAVAANQAEGVYTGTFNVTADYQ
ncbi:MAG TPA: DUF4402 domain-containing protein [Allosphingosinicella sp.]|jgi:hypothetical protein